MNKYYSFSIFAVFCLIFVLNILSFLNPILGALGTITWFVSYVFLIIFAGKSFVFLLQQVKQKKSILTILMIFVWITIILFNAKSIKNLSGETSIEIRCAISQLQNEKDMGYNKTCLFGYPSRQYFLPSLPTLTFGRSQFNLNFGGALYFIIGIIIFSSGAIRFLKKNLAGDIIVATLLSFVLHFYYVIHFLLSFEQSIFPFSFVLITCGLIFHFKETKKNEPLFLLAILSDYLIYSYTPSLFFFFLLILILLYFLSRKKIVKNQKIFVLAIVAISIFNFLLSLKIRYDINIFAQERPLPQLLYDLNLTFNHLIFQNKGNPFVSPVFNYIFLPIVFLSYFYFFRSKFFAAALWIFSVIAFSVISKGYAYYGIDFRLHRANVIFPVILSMLVILFKKIKTDGFFFKVILFGVFVFYLATGINFYNNIIKSKNDNYHLQLINWFLEKNLINPERKVNFIIDSNTSPSYISLYDYAQYFAPKGESQILSSTSSCEFETHKDADNFFLTGKNPSCPSKVPFNQLKLLKEDEAIKIYKYEN